MKKRLLSMLLCLCLACTLLPATALAAGTDYGISVGGVAVTSDNAGNITGSGITGSVSYNPGNNTLTLNNASITVTSGGIDGILTENALDIELIGENSITSGEGYGISVHGNLCIFGASADTAKLTVNSALDGIFAYDHTPYDEELTIDDVTLDVTATGVTGISASKSVTITDSVVTTTGNKYGLQGGDFGYSYNDANPSIINISNSSVTAQATNYYTDSEAKAFKAAPIISGSWRWRADTNDASWAAGSSTDPDFSQTYLELQCIHGDHPVCGASCDHSGSDAHSDVTWIGVSDLSSITTAGNYYLTDDVTLTEKWEPVNGVILCLNGNNITQTDDSDSPVIEVDDTFTLTDCSDTPGKITHAAGASGLGINCYGEVILYGGDVTGNTDGGVAAAGKITLDGGCICENDGSGGIIITSNNDDHVPGLLTIKSGTIENNQSSFMGGGVFAYASSASYPVKVIMEGGRIQNNAAVEGGGGVFVSGATLTMKGGSITGNSVTGTDAAGGGVLLSYGLDQNDNVLYPAINVSGGTISGNVKGSAANNLYLTSGQTVNMMGQPASTDKIGVTTETAPTADSAVPVTGTNSSDFRSYFTSDNAAYEPYNDSNVVKLRLKAAATVINAQAPIIVQGPAGTTYEKGAAAATLEVVATSPDGGTLTYQWSKGNGITGSNIVGATASTYTPPTDTVGKWEYSCTVTNTIPDNGDGGTKTAITVRSAWIEVVEGTGGTTTPTSGGSAMLAPRATYLGEGRFETRNVTGAPIEVLVNGEPVDFTPEEDGFSLYLPYLEAGRHQLTVRWNSRRLNTYFDYEGGMELVVTIPGDMVLDPPKTGDSGALWLCTGLMLFGLSGLLLSGLVRYNRKRGH